MSNLDSPMLSRFTVEELVAMWPDAESILARHGIDTCCGGILPVEEAARQHNVPLAGLIEELLKAIVEPAPASAAQPEG